LEDISVKDETKALNEITDLIRNYYLKKGHVDTVPEDKVKQIIKIKNEKKKIKLEKIADGVQLSIDKVRGILIKNELLDLKQEAVKKLNIIKKIAQSPKALDKIEKKGIVDFKGIPEFSDIILQSTAKEFGVMMSAKTDEPVTTDTKRLIRMPLSLHGGTGMKVCQVPISEFKNFDPLKDAIVFGNREITIKVTPDLKPINSIIEMKGKTFRIKEGIQTVPEYLAIFLMCRGAARYG